jgi:hypothetical protein
VFQIPDVYGVYQFKVNYHRLGLTRISTANQVRYATERHWYGTGAGAGAGTVPVTQIKQVMLAGPCTKYICQIDNTASNNFVPQISS